LQVAMTQRDCGNTPAGLQSAIDSVQAVLSSIELEIPAAFQARRVPLARDSRVRI
jgi:hypothetical protein